VCEEPHEKRIKVLAGQECGQSRGDAETGVTNRKDSKGEGMKILNNRRKKGEEAKVDQQPKPKRYGASF